MPLRATEARIDVGPGKADFHRSTAGSNLGLCDLRKYGFLDQFVELKTVNHRYNHDHVAQRQGNDQTFTEARTQ